MKPGTIGLGDVMRAIAAIAPDQPARWPAIAATLGFELPQETAPAPEPATSAARRRPASGAPRQLALEDKGRQHEASLKILAPLEPAHQSGAPPPFLVDVAHLPVEQAPVAGGPRVPVLQPLLAPATAPSVLRAAAILREERGPIDTRQVVDGLARRRPLQRLPRRRSFGLAHDVIVLQDLGAGMDAWIEDVDPLLATLRAVAGRSAVRITGFLGRPASALQEIGVYRGSVVLVLTDLGLTRLARPEETGVQRWIELADVAARAAARVTLMVAWPAGRWPPAVAARLAMLTWDRTTTVGDVLRAVREHG